MSYVKRFSRTERTVHWVNASAFLLLLVTGMALYIPSIEVLLGRRPLLKDIHFWAGVCWLPAFAVLFLVSGLLLWAGERNTRFRFASTVVLHDGLFFAAFGLLVGHLYLTLIHPATRHSLRGMTLGTVKEEWAEQHYPRWDTRPSR